MMVFTNAISHVAVQSHRPSIAAVLYPRQELHFPASIAFPFGASENISSLEAVAASTLFPLDTLSTVEIGPSYEL
jgi:hypothetical protein